jgi:hypothetical protein
VCVVQVEVVEVAWPAAVAEQAAALAAAVVVEEAAPLAAARAEEAAPLAAAVVVEGPHSSRPPHQSHRAPSAASTGGLHQQQHSRHHRVGPSCLAQASAP